MELRIEFPNHVIDFIDFALCNLLDLDDFREFHSTTGTEILKR